MSTSTTTTCPICVETYNKRSRAITSCQYCEYDACSQCCQTYILSESVPKCMNRECNREWTRKFMLETFPATFINGKWKAHREQLIFDTERALLPATQLLIEQMNRREEIKEQIQILRLRIQVLSDDLYQVGREPERQQFTRACPDSDCRGFLSTQSKCGLCSKWTCPTCNVVKGCDRNAPHECNPDDVASAALIRQDTKQCPNCSMGIFRIEGCSQMWCTQCNTAFCWNTGRIETNVHNPHYFEWLRRTGGNVDIARNPLDILCGRELNHQFMRTLRNSMKSKRCTDDDMKKIMNLGQSLTHIIYIDLPTYRVDNVQNNQALRIQYMRKYITEEKFKAQLQKNDKKYHKYREISELLRMFTTTCTDIFHRFVEEMNKPEWKKNDFTILNEITSLRQYSNNCLKEISEVYGSSRSTPCSRLYIHKTSENTLRLIAFKTGAEIA